MPIKGKFIARLQNTGVDPANYQVIDFDVDSLILTPYGPTYSNVDECAATILVYLATIGSAMADGTSIADLQFRADPSAGAVSVPFPAADYATIGAAAVVAGYTPPSMSAYGLDIGTGALAPLGTSISVSELTQTIGRTGRGRHFVGFIQSGVVASNGGVASSTQSFITDAATDILLGAAYVTAPALAGIPWAVTGPASPTYKAITSVKVQPVFSNLESRRR